MFPPFIIHDSFEETRKLVLEFIDGFSQCFFLDSNRDAECPVPVTGINYDFIAAAGAVAATGGNETDLNQLQNFIDEHRERKNWIFGFLTYDIKNQIEKLTSENPVSIGFPGMYFFVPEFLFVSRNGITEISSCTKDPESAWKLFLKGRKPSDNVIETRIQISHIPGRDEYLKSVSRIQHHIHRGDIYEVNYCCQVAGSVTSFDPVASCLQLFKFSPAPFACYVKLNHNYLLCSSPERFLAKRGSAVISQPVKGTARRGTDSHSDRIIREQLSVNEKERSENVMIVDLVRNDLSKIAARGTVKADELFGVYTFARVHQMISTVSCKMREDTNFTDVIRAAFPMGSMTGAPKVSAMKIIDAAEDFKRELFSGSVGYIDPEGDFDFNVVIRSILYNSQTNVITVPAGSAITAASNPSGEYEEMVLKLKPQLQVLGIDSEKLFNTDIHTTHA